MSDLIYHIVADSEQVGEGKGFRAVIGDLPLAIIRSEGKLYAIDEMCTHADASLAFGPIKDGCVMCPWHYAEFDLETGESKTGPAVKDVQTYAVREIDGKVEVGIAPA